MVILILLRAWKLKQYLIDTGNQIKLLVLDQLHSEILKNAIKN